MTECCCDDIIIEVNEEGIDGVGITSIVLVSTVGITKNYRINLTNGTYFDYSISDGSSIASISKTSSVGLVDTYTVLLTSGDTTTFEVTNGNGIASIVKTSTDNLTDTYTISYTNGATSTFSVVNGNSIASVSKVSTQVLTDTYQITYTDENKSPDTFTVINGRGIVSIAKTSTSGLVDTYTITYNDNSTSTFTVTNGEKGDKGDTGDTGNGIQSISLLSESGLVKTYRITMTDGTHFDFDVTDGEKGDTGETGATGNGIASIEKTATVGLVDTYTITMTDGTTTTFTVTNGSDMWGNITGTLSDQTDLQTALDSKAPAITETASGSIASFTDGSALPVESLSVAIEPVQDLHGYDAPWPAGGGKNLLPKGESIVRGGITFTVNDDGTVTVTGSDTTARFWGVQFTIPAGTYILNGCPSGGGNSSYMIDVRNNVAGAGISGISADTGSGSTFTITESLTAYVNIRIAGGYTIPTGGIKLSPMIRLASVSDATFAPYSNICPISGHTSATVTRAGKNLSDKIVSNEMATGSVSDGVFTSTERTGTGYLNVARLVLNQPVLLKAGVTYYFALDIKLTSGTGLINTINLLTSANDGIERTNVSVPTPSATYQHFILKCTLATDTLISKMYVQGQNCSNAVFVITNPMISTEPISPESTFEPYQGQTVTIDLDGTRYGGTLDVTTGMLTVTKGCFTLTGASSEHWGTATVGSNYYSIPLWGNSAWKPSNTAICDKFPKIELSQRGQITGLVSFSSDNGYRFSFNSDFGITTTAELRTWLSTNPVTICAELATPLTVQLTPSQMMQTLLGENHIWADTGDVEVTYRADTKLFIQEQIAESETLTRKMIADIATADGKAPKSLATGDLIIVGDELRKATANIGNGSAITASNSTTATLADVIKALQ